MQHEDYIRGLLTRLHGGSAEQVVKKSKEITKQQAFQKGKLKKLETDRLAHLKKLKSMGWGFEEGGDVVSTRKEREKEKKEKMEQRAKLFGPEYASEESGAWSEADTRAQRGLGIDTGYCVKCKEKVTMENPHEVTTKNGRRMLQGICEKCDTKVCKFIPS